MSKKQGHHGGAWKVAYADFVTAMMALFLVLWLTAQDVKIKEAVERAFRNPFSAVNKESTGIIPNKDASATPQKPNHIPPLNAVELEMLKHITEDLSKILQENEDARDTVQFELLSDGLHINIFDRTHKPVFEPNSDVFTTYGVWVFSTLAWEIARYSTFHVELEGHTEAFTESEQLTPGKWGLSSMRANAARRQIVLSGVQPSQIFKISGFADTQPMPNTEPTAEINRRVTVLLKVKDLSERSDYKTGKLNP